MKGVNQSKFGSESNALQAVVATIIGKELEEVLEFPQDQPWDDVKEFLESEGYDLVHTPVQEDLEKSKLYLQEGKSRRGDVHYVVMLDGALYHDPHQDRTGLVSATAYYEVVKK